MFFSKKIGIDLGTCNVIVCEGNKGILINEPAVVVVSEGKILSIGEKAKEMLGKTPQNIEVVYPLKDGVIANYMVTEALIRYLINQVCGGIRFAKPEVMIAVPGGSTSTERKAARDATIEAGAKEAYLIEEPLAAAIGANIPVADPSGSMVVDIGGGTTETAIISLAGIVTSDSIRMGGNEFDKAIVSYLRKNYNLMIGEQTAEKIKIKIGRALPGEREEVMEVQGRDLLAGLPQKIEISSAEVVAAIRPCLKEIIQSVKSVLEKTPPELSSDIIDRGIIITGGSALLRDIDDYFARELDVVCQIADEPDLCVAKGLNKALGHLNFYKKTIS